MLIIFKIRWIVKKNQNRKKKKKISNYNKIKNKELSKRNKKMNQI